MVGTDLAQHLTDDTLTLASGLDTEDIERYLQKVDKLYASKKPRAAVHSVKKDTDSKETDVSDGYSAIRAAKTCAKNMRHWNFRNWDFIAILRGVYHRDHKSISSIPLSIPSIPMISST